MIRISYFFINFFSQSANGKQYFEKHFPDSVIGLHRVAIT